jgi:hypothetical protein
MSDYKSKLENLKALQYEEAEKILKDSSIDPYNKFEMIDDIYPLDSFICYPFKTLAEEALKDKVPTENLKHIRPNYFYLEYSERHQDITFSGFVEGFMEVVGMEFDPDMEREFGEFTEEELNAPIIELFTFDNVAYKFSFNEIINTLIKYTIETKTSGFVYDW